MGSLILVTDRFPYGRSEAFIEPEIEVLSDQFSRVYVCPQRSGGPMRPLPENVEVKNIFPPIERIGWRAVAALRGIASPLAWQELLSAGVMPSGARLREVLSYAGFSALYATRLLALSRSVEELQAVYSYWSDRGGMAVARMDAARRRSVLSASSRVRLVARAHRWDLDDASSPTGRVPFRHMVLNALDQVAVISEHGLSYLNAHGAPSGKVSLHRLGVASPPDQDRPLCDGKALHVYSCSSLISLKRVDLIGRALRLAVARAPEWNFTWTHVGDGPEMGKLKGILEGVPSSRLHWDLKGLVPNSEVLRILDTQHFDLLLNVSEVEGIPVAAMEAASRGVPTAATDVGGNAEIVPDGLGWLLPKGIEEEALSEFLVALCRNRSVLEVARERALELWRRRFRAEDNLNRFVREVLKPDQRTGPNEGESAGVAAAGPPAL